MVNTAFARQFTWGCNFEGKCGIDHLCTSFALSKFDVNQIFRAVKFAFKIEVSIILKIIQRDDQLAKQNWFVR